MVVPKDSTETQMCGDAKLVPSDGEETHSPTHVLKPHHAMVLDKSEEAQKPVMNVKLDLKHHVIAINHSILTLGNAKLVMKVL